MFALQACQESGGISMSETRYIISDAAKMIDVEPHVLRYWEEELGMEIPRNEMGHRYYTDKEVKLFTMVRDLKDKGFQLKAIKMVISAIAEEEGNDNIISLDQVRKSHEDEAVKVELKDKEEDHRLEEQKKILTEKPVDQEENTQVQTMEAALSEPSGANLSAADKMSHFKYMMDSIVMQALKKNNEALEANLVAAVSDKVVKEMEHQFSVQAEKDEERYRLLDESIRKKQKGRKEAAASRVSPYGSQKQKRGLFRNRDF